MRNECQGTKLIKLRPFAKRRNRSTLQTLLNGNLIPGGTEEKVSFWAAMMPFEAALPKTMPNYYDESSIADHNSCF
ncbi:hypothetical protein DXC18_03655 [Collinsella sp. OM08-14AT]|nr:hypothetical protein DXC18_03655 [Collinsella sp. OM08-14AT]